MGMLTGASPAKWSLIDDETPVRCPASAGRRGLLRTLTICGILGWGARERGRVVREREKIKPRALRLRGCEQDRTAWSRFHQRLSLQVHIASRVFQFAGYSARQPTPLPHANTCLRPSQHSKVNCSTGKFSRSTKAFPIGAQVVAFNAWRAV